MILIGLSGKKRSGKDSFYEFTTQLIKGRVERVSFADALYDEVCTACSVDRKFIEKNKDTFRTILQWWGTDFRRQFSGQDYWTEKLKSKVYALPSASIKLCVVTDVRFKNEADLIKSLGGLMIRINSTRCTTTDNHPSETDLDFYHGFDSIINNDGTLEEYKFCIERVIKDINEMIKKGKIKRL